MAKSDHPRETQTTFESIRHTGRSIKETIESIVVAFILAFVFRAFVIEAFVIPTGSMAATLLGEHGVMTCSDCGYEYKYGTNNSVRPKCPNCFWEGEPAPYSGKSILSGDRILVLKWPLDIGGPRLGSKRWEVTVFKDPSDGVTNYIKRLVGLPNEVLEIIDGDVYTVSARDLDEQTVRDLDEIRHLNYLAGLPGTHKVPREHDSAELGRRRAKLSARVRPKLLSKYRIQRKREAAQSSLWFNVYNHDYVPQQNHRKQLVPHWRPAGPDWNTDDHSLTFSGQQVDEQAILFISGKPDGRITDFYAYNQGGMGGSPSPSVGDLRIQVVLFFEEGDGFVRFLLTKRDRGFWATIHADGRVTLEQTRRRPEVGTRLDGIPANQRSPLGDGEIVLGMLNPKKPLRVEFANVDYRVSLRINGRMVLASTDDQYGPDLQDIVQTSSYDFPARAEISARNMRFRLAHVVLERDEHYREARLRGETKYDGRIISNPWPGKEGWGTFGNPIYLRDREYFMLGDNSPASKDSRLWYEIGPHLLNRGENYQIGTVPEDQLIGKAFFVYWPSGYRLSSRLRLGLIPSVGAMRWIR